VFVWLLSKKLCTDIVGHMEFVQCVVRRRKSHSLPRVHGRFVRRCAVQSDARNRKLQHSRLPIQLSSVGVVRLDLLAFLWARHTGAHALHYRRRSKRWHMPGAQQFERNGFVQSRLLSAKLRSAAVVGLERVLGQLRRRLTVALAHNHACDMRWIVQRHANDANAAVQHAVLRAKLPD
jgi:hypothetical protein